MEKKLGIIAGEPLSQGFLSGKYGKNHTFLKTDSRSRYPKKLIQKLLVKSRKFESATKIGSWEEVRAGFIKKQRENREVFSFGG